ncbi:MAG: hypothetical protein IJT00_03625 [Lachnospiraceae bacterium]|nr:hypothetical protein [Lachnospiraceae bacterium]
MFEKKVTIFKKKDSATWKQIKDLLKNEGFKGVRAGHYFADPVAAGGCGAKLDPRSFSAGGRIDRDIYFIEVKEQDRDRALSVIHDNGLVAEVDEKAAMDAAEKVRLKTQ